MRHPDATPYHSAEIAAAPKCLDAFMAAFNARDLPGFPPSGSPWELDMTSIPGPAGEIGADAKVGCPDR